jgi:hypothetical protein
LLTAWVTAGAATLPREKKAVLSKIAYSRRCQERGVDWFSIRPVGRVLRSGKIEITIVD